MINWGEFKHDNSVIRVDRLNVVALSLLYENSLRMGTDNGGNVFNSNVETATQHPSKYMDSLVECIIDNVSFITKSPIFNLTEFKNGQLIQNTHHCEYATFNDIDSLKLFIKENGEFSILVLFSIIKYVDLDKLKAFWHIKYKMIEDLERKRDKKIDVILT